MTKYLVITGGSRGIGKAVINRFLQEGWQAANISRTPCDVAGVTNFSIDLSTADWHEKYGTAIREFVQTAERICLVNNAASHDKDNVESVDINTFRHTINVNLVSTLTLTQLLIPAMKPGSSIIYIGSTLSEMAVPNRFSYVTTKHALVGMMRSTCQDLQGKGITTCCICPGFVNTPMLTDHVGADVLNRIIKNKVTAGRMIETPEIAEFVYFCAHNPVINGAVLHANLGQINS